jgi:hypothetical protein
MLDPEVESIYSLKSSRHWLIWEVSALTWVFGGAAFVLGRRYFNNTILSELSILLVVTTVLAAVAYCRGIKYTRKAQIVRKAAEKAESRHLADTAVLEEAIRQIFPNDPRCDATSAFILELLAWKRTDDPGTTSFFLHAVVGMTYHCTAKNVLASIGALAERGFLVIAEEISITHTFWKEVLRVYPRPKVEGEI